MHWLSSLKFTKITILLLLILGFLFFLELRDQPDLPGKLYEATIIILLIIISKKIYESSLKSYNEIKEIKDREITLRNIISNILNSENFNQAINITLKNVTNLFGSEFSGFRYYDVNSKQFAKIGEDLIKNTNFIDEKTKNFLCGDFENIILETILRKKGCFSINIQDSPDEIKNYLKKFNIMSCTILPNFYQKKFVGLIFISNFNCIKKWNDKEIEFFNLLIQMITACLSMFHVNEKLKHSFQVEKSLREIIINLNSNLEEKQIYEDIMQKLVATFNAKGIVYFTQNQNNLNIFSEYSTDQTIFGEHELFCKIFFKDYLLNIKTPLIINNVQNEITNEEFKSCLIKKNITSFMYYPLNLSKEVEAENITITNTCFIYSDDKNTTWSSDYLTYFCFMVETINIIYSEISKRQMLEETRKNFIATLTHDLKSPILAEQKALEMMMSMNINQPMGNYIEYLQDMYTINEDLLKIINNLLSVYHYESGKWELNLRAYNVENIINDSVRALKHLAQSRNCEIITEFEENLPPAMVDEGEIKRVVMNLIGNAIKHTKPNTKIHIKSYKKDKEILVSINDNGQGIPPGIRDKIFERYQTQKRNVGSGLGLYLSKQIIEAHTGNIWFETEIEKGTTFYFTIPCS
jgi:anti-sigma regulatory factor (Ser/Thr protein kinase)